MVFEFMRGANQYANARNSPSGEEHEAWITPDGFRGLKYYRPFFRTVEGSNHTMFVVDVDTKIPRYLSRRLEENETRELRLRAVLGYFSEWFKTNKDYKFTSYVSGKGLYLVQRIDKAIDKRNLSVIAWSPPINEAGKYDSRLEDKGLFKACIKKLDNDRHKCDSKCDDWFRSSSKELSHFINFNGVEIELIVDLRMYLQAGPRLFRAPYSPYFKLHDPYYCAPLEFNGDDIDINLTIKKTKKRNLTVKPILIYPFQFEDRLDKEVSFEKKFYIDREISPARGISPIDVAEYKSIVIPEPEDELTVEDKGKLERMGREFSEDMMNCPPCILRHHNAETDNFWSRMVTTRYLGNKGYSVRDVALYNRFVLNDEEDNLPKNRNKLFYYLPQAFGQIDNPNRPPSCWKMQDEGSEFYAIEPKTCLECGRTYPLENLRVRRREIEKDKLIDEAKDIQTQPYFRKKKLLNGFWTNKRKDLLKEVMEEEKVGFERIKTLVGDVIDSKDNCELIKTTRCGVTTTLIHLAKEKKKKILVVAPTNKIGFKTFPEAMELGYRLYGLDTNGAILANNKRACLKLRIDARTMFQKKKDDPEWGERGVRYNDMAFHFKPPCVTNRNDQVDFCQFFTDTFPYPHRNDDIPYPVGDSEILNYGTSYESCEGLCAYSTIMNNLLKYDVIFMTYDKLNAVLSQRTEEMRDLLNFIKNRVDILFFDEISFLAQKPKIDISLAKEDISGVTSEFVNEVRKDIGVLTGEYNYEFIGKIVGVVESFIGIVDDFISNWQLNGKLQQSFSLPLDNPLTHEERAVIHDYFGAFHSILERHVKTENVYLENLEKILILLQEDRFYVSNYSTLDYKYVCSLTCSPIVNNIKAFAREFNVRDNKQVLVTDATMPFIKMSDLFGIRFKRVLIGDPRFTNKYQLIVADTKKVSVVTLMNKELGNKNYMKLYEHVNNVCKIHSPKDIMLVLPNSGLIYSKVQNAQRKGMIDKELEITYYRSDKTIGVATRRRVMIAVCTPLPPPNSHIWLASYYKDMGLYEDTPLEELSAELEKMSAFQTFYQTIGRVKDPSNKVNSIVYLWGVKREDVDEILSPEKDVPRPQIISMPSHGDRDVYITITSLMWINFRMSVPEETFQLFSYIRKTTRIGKKHYLSKIFNDLKFTASQVRRIYTTNVEILSFLGIEVTKTYQNSYSVEMLREDFDELIKDIEDLRGGSNVVVVNQVQ